MAVDLSTYGGSLLPEGYPGAIVDGNPTTVVSKTNDQSVAIDFGVAVARSAADETCKAPTVDGDLIIGISVRLATKVSVNGVVNYAQLDAVPICREGFIFAIATENVVRGTQVLSLTAQNGKLASTTGGAAGTGRVAVPGAQWETTTAAGALGKIRINN